MPGFAVIRQIEAVGFRAWPAATVHYDGSWAIRLTSGHPSKRLNSVNPLDPGDTRDMELRVERAAQRFHAFGRAPMFRSSPLAPPELDAYLDGLGWRRFDETIVMTANIAALDLTDAIDQIPMKDVGRFVEAMLSVNDLDSSMRSGLSEILESIRPSKGFFTTQRDDGEPVSTAICVHDGALAGLFEIATMLDHRRSGHARNIVTSAMKWARQQGARTAWLQVEAANMPAIALYNQLGFSEVYRYVYREGPQL